MHGALAFRGLFAFSGLAFGATFTLATQSHACSCGANGEIISSQPADGATGVPINFAPFVTASVADWPAADAQTGAVVLLDEAGDLVLAERRTFVANALLCNAQIEWLPSEPLKPNHTYTIVVQRTPVTPEPFVDADSPDDWAFDSISFTTGNDALDLPAPVKPEIVTALFHPTNGVSTCDVSSYQGCVASKEPQVLEVSTHWSGGVLTSALVDQVAELSFAEEAESNCLEVRARDLTGRRSAPATLCASLDDFVAVGTTSFTSNGWCHLNAAGEFDNLPNDAAPTDAPPESNNCSLTRGISKIPAWQGLLLLLVAVAAVCRRRHHRGGVFPPPIIADHHRNRVVIRRTGIVDRGGRTPPLRMR